jgi:hypothetical protein
VVAAYFPGHVFDKRSREHSRIGRFTRKREHDERYDRNQLRAKVRVDGQARLSLSPSYSDSPFRSPHTTARA